MKGNALCENCREELKAYADGELPLWRRAAVRRHLSGCAPCQAELTEIERITAIMKHNPIPALSPGIREKLLTAVQPIPKNETTSAPWRLRPSLAIATSAAVVVVSFFTFNTLFRSAQMLPDMQESAKKAGVASQMYAQDYDEKIPQRGADVTAGEAASVATAAAPASVQNGLSSARTERFLFEQQDKAGNANPYAEAMRNGNREQRRAFLPTSQASAIELKQRFRGVVDGNGSLSTLRQQAGIEERQVHREASVGVKVDKLEDASDRVETMVKALGGYVASNNLSTDADGYKSADLVVKVPEKDFEKTLADIGKLGDIVSKNVTGEDITEQMSDATSDEQVLVDEVSKAETRLKNETMSEKRTGQKEEELRQMRIQLSRTRARLGLLRKMATLSTLNVSLTQKAKKAAAAPSQPGWLTDLRETNRAASLAFQSAVRVPVVLFIWILAFSPLWIPLIIAYRYAALKTALTKTPPEKTAEAEG